MKEINDKEISKWTNNYIDNLPDGWNTELDMRIAVKNAMLEALSYPEKYIKNNVTLGSVSKKDHEEALKIEYDKGYYKGTQVGGDPF